MIVGTSSVYPASYISAVPEHAHDLRPKRTTMYIDLTQGQGSSSSSSSSSTIPTSNSLQTSHRELGAAAETYLTNRSTPSSRRTRCKQLKCGCQVKSVPSSSPSSPSSTSSSALFGADAPLDSGRSFACDCLLGPERYTAGSSSSSCGAI